MFMSNLLDIKQILFVLFTITLNFIEYIHFFIFKESCKSILHDLSSNYSFENISGIIYESPAVWVDGRSSFDLSKCISNMHVPADSKAMASITPHIDPAGTITPCLASNHAGNRTPTGAAVNKPGPNALGFSDSGSTPCSLGWSVGVTKELVCVGLARHDGNWLIGTVNVEENLCRVEVRGKPHALRDYYVSCL